jgi:negative regulator of genetic competence, sporulation and motility
LEGKQELSNQCIQIKLKFKKFERIITYSVPNIGLNINNEAYALNDETFFYVMVSKFLRDEKIISTNKAIQLKCKEII